MAVQCAASTARCSHRSLPRNRRCCSLQATYNGDQSELFVEGNRVAKSGGAAGRLVYPESKDSSLLFLAVHGEADSLRGSIDDVALWSTALTDADIASHALSRKTTAQILSTAVEDGQQALLAWYPFGPGATVPQVRAVV